MWEATGVPEENPHMYRENMQTPCRQSRGLDSNLGPSICKATVQTTSLPSSPININIVISCNVTTVCACHFHPSTLTFIPIALSSPKCSGSLWRLLIILRSKIRYLKNALLSPAMALGYELQLLKSQFLYGTAE
ncbi:hypothetical protein AMECASPLE_010447 [Ameca splendens]|uniref:Uncharacterized protein n=1 Tax=Ameca splendens TaxID=208324 RepID=A0ABV0Y0N2_9TELE